MISSLIEFNKPLNLNYLIRFTSPFLNQLKHYFKNKNYLIPFGFFFNSGIAQTVETPKTFVLLHIVLLFNIYLSYKYTASIRILTPLPLEY